MHETMLNQEIEASIDARGSGGGIVRTKHVEQLIGGEWSLFGEELGKRRASLPSHSAAPLPTERLKTVKRLPDIPCRCHVALPNRSSLSIGGNPIGNVGWATSSEYADLT